MPASSVVDAVGMLNITQWRIGLAPRESPSCMMSLMATAAGNAPRSSTFSSRVPPSTYSMAMAGNPSISSVRYT